MTPTFALLPLCLLGSAALAAPVLDDAVRQRAEELTRTGMLPSIVIAVIDGKTSAVYGFGSVHAGKNTKPGADTVYQIGSVTKTMTALLLADAVVEGKVKLDEPVAAVLPEYTMPAFDGKQISLLDLATHYSSLPRLPDNFAPKDPANPYADYTEAKQRQFLAAYHLPRAPGTKFDYSNIGYAVLGTALAAQAGTSYEALLQKRIAVPLGMRSTSNTPTHGMLARLAPGRLLSGEPTPAWDLNVVAPAGGVYSSARDMVAYLQAYMFKPLRPYALALKPQRQLAPDSETKIGLAWLLEQRQGQSYAWHSGQTGGYTSYAAFTTDGKRGVVVLTNAARDIDALGLSALLPGTPLPPLKKPPAAIELPRAALAEYVGEYPLDKDFTLTVTLGKHGLEAAGTGVGSAPLFASAKDQFFFRAIEADLAFTRDAAGKIAGAVLTQGGQEVVLPRKP
ncbi:D-alanyl-D-alanine-carboxypeptidase/endopeptidase AmpH precursor [Janthinobacterium sp. HH107]|uniref:serine hydrolase domain-containing protein n=1 Tax=unclassified Janthinobacterium TaxID=2610881 RepID=UPI000873862C|nr:MULTISPECIES: serine hydrolase domain-containing protein [unclassified Janthinobacterium]OEZ93419.1 D-alanyl-D-alanine-carboxypeptidase/endopeptidase AmpH precursor [Janthinobacterium sp. HH106]OFA05281.1 D-alanyl-D-alanine-carboxypeptidase/endopeptidase AmpH precursor [Janthinobacterium sp. HH107]